MPFPFRKPRRLSITVSHRLYEALLRCSDEQGRSLSNYAAFLLESSLERNSTDGQPLERSAAVIPVNIQRTPQPVAMFRPDFSRRFDPDPSAKTKQPAA
jgi:hypothetical protein